MLNARLRTATVLVALLSLLVAACGGGDGEPAAGGDTAGPTGQAGSGQAGGEASGTLRVYASVTQETVDAVIAAFEEANPDVTVELFRAPTGQINARLAAERREGEIRADVLWLTDPLSMQQYASDDVLAPFTPDNIDVVPEEFRQETFFGTRLLNIVLVHGEGLEPAPTAWQDLAEDDYDQPVAVPDPGFAGSAFGALGYFARTDDFGFDYYRALADNGLVQVQAPGEVVTGVAEGRFAAGMTLAKSARAAVENGSPVGFVFPEPGAISIYSPIGVVASTSQQAAAESFASFTITEQAQQAVADTGWQPIRDDVDWPHTTSPTVTIDWEAAFGQQEELLSEYRSIIGG